MNRISVNNPAITCSPFRRYVLSLFAGIENGSLKLILPDQSTLEFGDGTGEEISLEITSERFFDCCFFHGDVGFGESYTEGYWNTNDLTGLITLFIQNLENIPGISGSKTQKLFFNVFKTYNKLLHRFRFNSLKGSRKNIRSHYDLSNDLFSLFLDETMSYSGAFFKDPDMTLEAAQHAKYKRLWLKMGIQRSDHVLEIGCGWGYNAVAMAKEYGCRVTAITISEEQFGIARQRVQDAGLDHLVDIRFCDYRNITGRFSKIISVEMLEAVGHEYYDVYFRKLGSLLTQNGVAGIQVITCPESRYQELRKGVDWIQKHVFPGTLLPSVGIVTSHMAANTNLSLVDMKDLGIHYAHTLKLWRERFNESAEKVVQLGFDAQFQRKWNYYLSYCEAAFRTRNINVMQMIFSSPNNSSYT